MLKFLIRTSAAALVLLALAASPTISKFNKPVETVAVSAPKTTVVTKNTVVETIVAKEDDRAQKLAAYFATKNSPFVNVASAFVDAADKYEIDYRLLPAITGVESSFGVHVPAYTYNAYGWNNGKYRFQSWANAVEVVAVGLRTRYAPSGDITPYRIGKMYAASPTWAVRVAKYEFEIGLFASR